MKPGSDHPLLPALLLVVSLAVHAGLALVLAHHRLPVYEPLARAEPERIEVVLLSEPQPPEDRYTRLGEDDSDGDAAHRSLLDEPPQQAKQAEQAQADLSLDPQGTGQASAEQSPTPPQADPEPVYPTDPEPSALTVVEAPLMDPAAPQAVPEVSTLAMKPQPQTPPITPVPRTDPSIPDDPSPQADTESDAFSAQAYVEFSRGRTNVQLGRKSRLTRPRLTLYGQVDLVARAKPSLVLQIRIDAQGDVRGVEVIRSSGSPDIDQACRVAAFEWWFEPRLDAHGQPLEQETFEFTIRFR